MGNFLQELQRRSVFRVAAAYLVVGWLITQAVATIEGPLHLPSWTDTLVIVLLLCGLPVALILAWAFEVTPQGVQRTASADTVGTASSPSHVLDYAILGVLVIVAALIGWQQISGSGNRPAEAGTEIALSADAAGEPAGAEGDLVSVVTPSGAGHAQAISAGDQGSAASNAPELTVAVLPFTAFSSDEADGYFADGLTEEILNSLASVPELLVTSRTSAFQFRGDNVPSIPEIAQSLGVAHVLEGSVRRQGDQVRVTAQLIRAADDRHLWSQTYDRTMDDVFAIQEDIAENVAEVLQVVLDSQRRARMRNSGTRNIDAFIAYQQGSDLWNRAHVEVDYDLLAQAEPFFQTATELAPDYSEAYLLQSDHYSHRMLNMSESGDVIDQAEYDRLDARRTELLMAARSSAAMPERQAMADANLLLFSQDWTSARSVIARALSGDECANDNWLQFLIGLWGEMEERMDYARRQVTCDPLNPDVQILLAETLLASEDYAAVLTVSESLEEMGKAYESEDFRFHALLGLGRIEDARAMLGDDWAWERFRLAAMVGDAEGVAEGVEELGGTTDWFGLVVHATAGDRETANTIAAGMDARPLGIVTLMDAITVCKCGAPFDLSAVPNFAARIDEAGFPWPPAGDLGFAAMAVD